MSNMGLTKKPGVNSGGHEKLAVPPSYKTPAVYNIVCNNTNE